MRRASQRRAVRGVVRYVCVGIVLAGGWYAWHEGPYLNWERYVLPLGGETLTIRHDAKGSGHFGASRSGGRTHNGIDLIGAIGDPVYAMRSGYVEDSDHDRGMGHYVYLDHGRGFVSRFGHLSERLVQTGQRVRQGETIGRVGKSGNAKSRRIVPHIHMELLQDGRVIDPMTIPLLRERTVDPGRD